MTVRNTIDLFHLCFGKTNKKNNNKTCAIIRQGHKCSNRLVLYVSTDVVRCVVVTDMMFHLLQLISI